jgi:transcriptional regulator with XRE-family HTH domain
MYYSETMISGDLIKEARKRAGLTQAELGARIGKSQTAIARWERDEVRPSLETLREIIRGCGLDLSFFILRMTTKERFVDLITRVRFIEQRERRELRRVGDSPVPT